MNARQVLDYTKKMTLLYVEDDVSLRLSTQKLFENFFESVQVASDGEEGLYLYLEGVRRKQPYSLIISDISMPNLDGIAMCEAIMNNNPAQPFIFVTAYNETNHLMRAVEMGASGFLTKPIQYDHLIRTLSRVGQAYSYHHFFEEKYASVSALYLEVEAQRAELESKNRELETAIQLITSQS
jgi:CheY-like chemotaxis protein